LYLDIFIKYGLYHYNLLQMVLHWLLPSGNISSHSDMIMLTMVIYHARMLMYRLSLMFNHLALIIYHNVISLFINMKYERNVFWVTSAYFPTIISLAHSGHWTALGTEEIKNRLKILTAVRTNMTDIWNMTTGLNGALFRKPAILTPLRCVSWDYKQLWHWLEIYSEAAKATTGKQRGRNVKLKPTCRLLYGRKDS
jgi:hypothetical protein